MTSGDQLPAAELTDTIAAAATAIGPCGIGVIRISGPEAFTAAGRIFQSSSGKTPVDFPSHTVHHGRLMHPSSGVLIDDVLLTVFRAPSSYTGEDTVEISCHGGAITLALVLQAALAAGPRLAEPGEFTKRAFLNGRMDLTQAEAINDIIRARTNDAQRLALRQLGGALSTEVRALTDSILSILSSIEAAVDFPDDVAEPDYHQIAIDVDQMAGKLDELISSSDRGRVYREGIALAIVGRPNVGKSSLLNSLLRQSRAIVTPIPGTTRDVIEETINIRGIPVVAADTAGLRESSDEVERIGIELAERAMAAAGLVLVVLDATTDINAEDRRILARAGQPALVVLNKIDLIPQEDRRAVVLKAAQELEVTDILPISAATGEGIEELEDRIAGLVLRGEAGTAEGVIVTNIRHKQALIDARESLGRALETLEQGLPVDFLSVDLIAARISLGDITGDTASDDLIDRIFADFCIGK